jgi:CDGSH-type Zn-finger protein
MSADDQPNRPAATITPYRNGPYLLRGDFAIVDQDGTEIGRSRDTVALCRCGRSQSKPFCDGTHKVVGFVADSEAEEPRPLTPPEDLASLSAAERSAADRDDAPGGQPAGA